MAWTRQGVVNIGRQYFFNSACHHTGEPNKYQGYQNIESQVKDDYLCCRTGNKRTGVFEPQASEWCYSQNATNLYKQMVNTITHECNFITTPIYRTSGTSANIVFIQLRLSKAILLRL